MYEGEFADIYDRIHAHRGKDYAGEARLIADLVRARNPTAASVLDVASGTGRHLAHLRAEFPDAAGLEQSPEMIAVAKRRIPEITVHQGDMRDFELGRSFDVVTLMFSSIGYVDDYPDLARTLATLGRHLTPGGVVVIEPWVFPDTFAPGYVSTDLVRDDEGAVARFSHSIREGDAVVMSVQYLVATAEHGIRHLTDRHRLALFTREQYLAAFEAAGCPAEFVRPEPFGRGLFIGVRKS
ncbi:class I SAM-dependent methyltransferase [Nocardia sp. CDC159]|uniref:Class I SAM-dependent methyltransferase n=1 Tax=Nocardia pulmonis TaxID=2951408 RepID=A0A9X2ITJ4_9NOCA|nr:MULTISPECIES: class I SAM-dependent methyltransferase [Nocardia]MCM6771877.1 class I SAM-dependent methyltransferase [Nocardia pulmonis]MCM6785465.1 class I SAM-dependent methyltransferase [Nocardia sp. CDC159]